MFRLPPELGALAAWRQFIVFQLLPSATRPGKTDKVPISPFTGSLHDAHDSSIWSDWETAALYAETFGADFGVGFVFTKNDPFFFIDIDECAVPDGNGWSDTANALMGRFVGAAVEISASGRGLHIIGTGDAGPPPPARKVKYAHYFDLYTENRFVALTGTNAIGDAATVHTPALGELVRQYLTPDASVAADWTDRPRDDWNGPADDEDLLRRAMASQSGPQAFGVRASFADLFMADVDKLRKFYPDPERADGYNASSADSALAQSLAFWTGGDCERIKRLMLRSALVRPKWDREDYLRRTILGVAARQYTILADKKPEPLHLPVAQGAATPAVDVTGETFLNGEAQKGVFAGCVYIVNKNRILVPGGYLLKQDQFRVSYGGYSFPMDQANERISRNAWEAFTESQLVRFPRADGITFRPERQPAEIFDDAGMKLANVWWPIETPCADGDATPFVRHMEKLLPVEDDRKKLLAFMAACLQYPGQKFQWAPLLQGVEGNGKTFLLTAMVRAIGERYSHLPNAQDLAGNGGKFTGWLEQKLFLGIEEIYSGDRRELMEVLKPIITNSRIEIQAKGMDQITGDNRANVMACSNHKDAIPKNANDRRWAIFFCAQQAMEDLARDGMSGAYMPDLWDWAEGRNAYQGQTPGFSVINNYLRTWAIPDEINPAKSLHRAPDTTSTQEAITLSIGAIEQEIVEAIEQELPGFAGGWVSSMALDGLLRRIGAERRVPPRRRREMLKTLGYDWHPIFEQGRVPHSVQPDGGRTRLFAKKGHIINDIPNTRLAAKTYTDTQMKAVADKANFGVDGIGNKA